jgi:hypothetical protein
MYQMYPEAWPVSGARRPQPAVEQPAVEQPADEQPRRRARKEHSVVPAALALPVPVDRVPEAGSR